MRIQKLEDAMEKSQNGKRQTDTSAWAPARLRLLADLKEEAAHRGTSTYGDGAPRGIAIWSLGRCATGTFADSVKESAALVYCNMRKEGFGFVGLSDAQLEPGSEKGDGFSPFSRAS